MSRIINKIILHCDGSDSPKWGLKELELLHIDRGFQGIGYHFWIDSHGIAHETRKVAIQGAHTFGHNHDSVGICLHGKNTYTFAQLNSCAYICAELIKRFGLSVNDIHAHNEYTDKKTCPNFKIEEVKALVQEEFEGKPMIKDEVKSNIDGLIAVMHSLEAIIECVALVAQDGKIGIGDLAHLLGLGKRYKLFVEAVGQLKQIPNELKDLDKDEIAQLFQELMSIVLQLKVIVSKK